MATTVSPKTSLSNNVKQAKSVKARHHDPNQILSESSIRYNDYLLDYCQTSMSALSGCAAGIMGLTGLYGFVFYFVSSLCLSLIILISMGANSKKYFLSRKTIITGTLWSGIQTYLLFWTFLFGMVHVY